MYIFSIGHGNKTIEEFIAELRSFDIAFLIDVRTKPYSKWYPAYNQNMLKEILAKHSIKYVYLGNVLGGLPNDTSCYVDGKVSYDILKTKPFFKEGLQRLILAETKGINVAVMCSEGNPAECHRTKVIGVELQRTGISLRHIVGIGKEKSQNQAIVEATNGNGLLNLFGEEALTSRKQYV
ncbi:MAG: DUF488 domain-containing protein [Bacteroidales bacterium]|jgi:uncharacterized protein (DUF488 family)|nr:DUF488 domain-containing protein [Bacteroidales bacterium]